MGLIESIQKDRNTLDESCGQRSDIEWKLQAREMIAAADEVLLRAKHAHDSFVRSLVSGIAGTLYKSDAPTAAERMRGMIFFNQAKIKNDTGSEEAMKIILKTATDNNLVAILHEASFDDKEVNLRFKSALPKAQPPDLQVSP